MVLVLIDRCYIIFGNCWGCTTHVAGFFRRASSLFAAADPREPFGAPVTPQPHPPRAGSEAPHFDSEPTILDLGWPPPFTAEEGLQWTIAKRY
jgi:hypothetical protein